MNLFGHAQSAHQRGDARAARRARARDARGLHASRRWSSSSERLAALAPAGLGHAFYASDGASATEIALKMSFHYWRNRGRPDKRGFVSLAGSYHGETLGALAVTDVALFRDVVRAAARAAMRSCRAPDAARRGSRVDAARRARSSASRAAPRATTAALIVEPLVQGASGMTMYDPRYLRRARELSHAPRRAPHRRRDHDGLRPHRNDVRVRAGGAAAPDFMCLSKGITGGYLPLSCVLCSDAIYAAFYADDAARGFLHSHSYTGNALACRAALAVLDIFRDDDVHRAQRATAPRAGPRCARARRGASARARLPPAAA